MPSAVASRVAGLFEENYPTAIVEHGFAADRDMNDGAVRCFDIVAEILERPMRGQLGQMGLPFRIVDILRRDVRTFLADDRRHIEAE